jgi:PAS domain S-box-containing protein
MARLHLALEASKAGTWEWDLRTGENFWSEETWQLYGLEPKNVKASYDTWLKTIHPEDQSRTSNAVRDAAAKGTELYVEYRMCETYGVNRWLMSRGQPLKNEKGIVDRYIGVVIDITERKATEEALLQSEERFRNVFERTALGIAIGDMEGRVIECNLALERMLQYSKDELRGKLFSDFTHPSDVKLVPFLIKGLKDGNHCNYAVEKRYIRKDGEVIWVNLSGSLIFDSNNEPLICIATIEDITERKHLQKKLDEYRENLERLVEERTKQLKDAERLAAIGATAGMVGHDIRNPLQAMTSDIYLLKDYLNSMPEHAVKKDVHESLAGIENNIEYINKIVADLQDYARPLKPDYAIVDLSELVVNVFETIAIPKNINTKKTIRAHSKLKTDPTFIRRALTNLVNNAVQAMPQGGELEIMAFEKENTVTITVSDTGVGIPEDVKPKLFTPMMTTKSRGQGLGLAVVKRLIEALNGQITFESQEKKGTKFIITLTLIN